MHKEKISSIVVGFSLGFLVAAGVFFAPQMLKEKPSSDVASILNKSQTTPAPAEQILSLTFPEMDQVAREKSITVGGKTKPNSTVIISTSVTDYVVDIDPSGNFAQKVDLNIGPQEIVTTAYLPTGESETIRRTVFYIPEDENEN